MVYTKKLQESLLRIIFVRAGLISRPAYLYNFAFLLLLLLDARYNSFSIESALSDSYPLLGNFIIIVSIQYARKHAK